MTPLNGYPGFAAYAVATILLCLNLMFLWMYSGLVRGRTKTALNAEDAAAFHATLVPADPPEVARVLRAHQNAQSSIFPFLLLGLVYLLGGGSATTSIVLCTVFTLARWLHSLAYLKGLQPWRTVFFLAGTVAIVAEMVAIAMLLLRTSGVPG